MEHIYELIFRIALITLKRIGLSTLPWGHPFSSKRGSDVSTPTHTCIFLSVRKLWIHLSMLFVIPNSPNFSIVPVVHIRSKAFSRSRKVATTILFSMKAIFMADSSHTVYGKDCGLKTQPAKVPRISASKPMYLTTQIPGRATYLRFSFRFFKKGSCQLLAKVCARSTG